MEAHSIPTSIENKESKLMEFYKEQLRDILWAEQKLLKTLPKLEKAATSAELKQAFRHHQEQTNTHINRLENVFDIAGEKVDSKKCIAMAGILDEGQDVIDDTDEDTAQRDVALIFAAQKAEHYEIATYGGLVSLSKTLGLGEAAEVLGTTLAEEKEMDALLTQIAERHINYDASREKS